KLPSLVSVFSTLGIFSYSIYLTHELVIMQSWRWITPGRLQIENVFLVVIPATILFAWVFFWFCEKPFMVKPAQAKELSHKESPQLPQITQVESA
ncbi:MAG TPA: hypothetical protein VFR12_06400, partial [Pyrinomonadaceae bacterium]|nr:hypothetical protein [Pyrinomonadaceae bacterium]